MTQPSILPPNSTALERALEATFATRIAALPMPIRHLWNPATCAASLLPWLAWSLSVDEWDAAWPEARQRAVIAASIGVHRRKGTISAVKAAMAAMGYGEVIITEGRETLVGGPWLVGNDNYAPGAADFLNNTFWAAGFTISGVTVTRIATGVDAAGVPWGEYILNGIVTAGGAFTLYAMSPDAIAAQGQVWTYGAIISLVSGSVSGGAGLRSELTFRNSSGLFAESNVSAVVVSASSVPTTATYATTVATTASAQMTVNARMQVGAIYNNAVYRISAVQLESGPTRTKIAPALRVGGAEHWAEYWLTINQVITPADADKIQQRLAQVAPARCRLTRIIVNNVANVVGGPWLIGDPTVTVGSTYRMEIENGVVA